MAGPTLTASYNAFITSQSGLSMVTAAFTPDPGDVIIVKALSADSSMTFGTPSGGGLAYASRYSLFTALFTGVQIWTAVAGGSPSAMTVTLTVAGTAHTHGMVVERWASAQLAGSPATGSAQSASGTPSATVTTAGADSVVSWVNGDWNEILGARTYRTPGIEVTSQQADSHYAGDWAYQAAAAAGSQTFGLTAPAGQKWTLAGIEIQAGVVAVTDPDTGSGADAGSVTHETAGDSDIGSAFDGGELTAQLGPYGPGAEQGTGAEAQLTGVSSGELGGGADAAGTVVIGVTQFRSDPDQTRRPPGF